MPDERTRAATPHRNPITTGEYVPDATPDAGSTRPTGPNLPNVAGDLPDIPGYVVTHELARGGMGRVLAATDLGFGRKVAVKVLLPGFDSGEAAGRFVREARITGRLAHPSIPPAHQLGELPDGSPFLAMKLVRGRTLSALLADRPTPAHDLPRFVGIVEQVAQAVGFAHSEGVVHRDLKPANVMVGAFGEVQVMDWGLAFETDDGGRMKEEPGTVGDSSATARGAVMGTPAYMAPEQARGEAVGVAADVFALGGILCEVLTGSRPFRGKSGAEVVEKAAAGDVSDAYARLDACGADAELIDVARRCLSPAADDRPADGTAVACLVAAYRSGVEERLRTAERERAAAQARAEEEANTRREAEARVTEQRRRKRVQLWLAAAAVLLVAGAGGVAVWRVDENGKKRIEAARLEGEEQERTTRNSDAVKDLLDRTEAELNLESAARAAPLLDQATRRTTDGAVTAHADRLAAYTRDLAMLQALDRVNDYRLQPWNARDLPPPERVAEKWTAVFAGYGILPGTTPPAEAAGRINGSPIRSALVAGLDMWLTASRLEAVRNLLAVVDTDPFRDEVRQALTTGSTTGLVALAGRPDWAKQPSGLLMAYSGSQGVPVATARAFLVQLLVVRRTDFSLLMQLGGTYPIHAEEVDGERVRCYQAAVALRPGNSAALNQLGNVLRRRKDLDGAAAAFREAIRLSPNYAPPHSNLGSTILDRKNLTSRDLDEAMEHFREAIRLDPTFAHPHAGLGTILVERKDTDGAVVEYREAIRLDPKLAYPHNRLGLILASKGDGDGAAAEHREAIRLDPKDARPHNDLGVLLRQRKDLAGAAACYREAIRLDPTLAYPHHNLGNVLRERKDLAGAAACYREAIRLAPGDPDTHNELGTVLRDQKNLAGAAACYREAIRLDPTLPHQHYNLGLVLSERKDLAGAAAAYREAIRLDPKNASAHNNLGVIYEDLLILDHAESAYREAVRLTPRNANAHANLGDVLRRQGRHAEAATAYRAALAIQPTFGGVWADLYYCERVVRGEVPTAPPPRAVGQ
ncbi:tetratricopeptide repeat protein [Urbifossiella limnaea]|uniref:Serine/threonine-protein kinase PknB n=1 Tax=Urbifossiella limnaea TaxID=2528023 RepID=A0A517XQD9_9BACT|nr:tetratricopeptide repeat protein [Urbifossiella limnaea]QDU19706.1 Serine/threonine-protein kinase PknB [Urbifossiella limnaea]